MCFFENPFQINGMVFIELLEGEKTPKTSLNWWSEDYVFFNDGLVQKIRKGTRNFPGFQKVMRIKSPLPTMVIIKTYYSTEEKDT